jgi:hypothetical protein
LVKSWLGREDSNLRTVESKSARILNDFNGFSDETADSAPRYINRLETRSEYITPSRPTFADGGHLKWRVRSEAKRHDNPAVDAIAREAADGPWVNIIAVREEDKDKPPVPSDRHRQAASPTWYAKIPLDTALASLATADPISRRRSSAPIM